uniref:Solute carrier family 40 protein n=1 Tax=Gongylonema pulchrum TaxID=637853 RepID=A0A183D251_9BILA
LSIFGIAGGPVLSVFCLGMFFPKIKGVAAFVAQLTSTLFCIFVAGGALLNHVGPVGLPLDRTCQNSNATLAFIESPEYGMVEPLHRPITQNLSRYLGQSVWRLNANAVTECIQMLDGSRDSSCSILTVTNRCLKRRAELDERI